MAIERVLATEGEGLRCLILDGEIGIGKTSLFDWAKTNAHERGFRVLSAQPIESEYQWEHAALADILEGVPTEHLDVLPEPQRRALGVTVLKDRLPANPVDVRTVATAVRRILRQVLSDGPLLIAIDDAQWLDAASTRVLSSALHRLSDQEILVIVTARGNWTAVPDLALISSFDRARVTRLTIGPLDFGATVEMLTSRIPQIDGRVKWQRIFNRSRGNPLFALQLCESNTTLSRGERDIVNVPESLRTLVGARIAQLSSDTFDVLLVASLSSEPFRAVIVGSAADVAHSPGNLERALETGFVSLIDEEVVFAHPLIRSAVISTASVTHRREVHRRLAEHVQYPSNQVLHRGLGAYPPDGAIAHELEEASQVAAERGNFETAAQFIALASVLTPPERVEDRTRLVAMEAGYRFETSDPERACALLERTIEETPAGPVRAELLRRLARFAVHRGDAIQLWIERLRMALEEAGDDPALRGAITLDLAVALTNVGDHTAANEFGLEALALVRAAGDRAREAQICAGLAYGAFFRGEGVRNDLMERALAGPRQSSQLAMELRPRFVIGRLKQLSDDGPGAHQLLGEEFRQSLDEGIEAGLNLLVCTLAELEIWSGNWPGADDILRDLALNSEGTVAFEILSGVRGLLRVLRGQIEDGRRDAEQGFAITSSMGLPEFMMINARTLAVADLSLGDAKAAHERLAPLTELALTIGMTEPGLLRFIPDDIEAMIRFGLMEEGGDLLEFFESHSTRLGRLSGLAASYRCRGLYLAAHGEVDRACEAAEKSVSLYQQLSMPFDVARSELTVGDFHRRARRKRLANEHMMSAETIFEGLGAPLWTQMAREARGRIGLRNATTSEGSTLLTEAERQVADLVVSGLTNSEVAGRLFMAQRTVESHLSKVYRKLGVNSRAHLTKVYQPLAT